MQWQPFPQSLVQSNDPNVCQNEYAQHGSLSSELIRCSAILQALKQLHQVDLLFL